MALHGCMGVDMRSINELHQDMAAALSMADHVPFSSAVSDTVIKLKDGNGYVSVFEIEGVDFETCGSEQIEIYKNQLHQMLVALGGGQYAIWSHKIRHRIKEEQKGEFDNQFCLEVANAYQEELAQTVMMRTAHFMTIVYRPFEQTGLNAIGFSNIESFIAFENESIEVINQVCEQVNSTLKKYKPRLLGEYTRNGVNYSELQSFLGFLINGEWLEIPTSSNRLDEYLCAARLTFGDRSGVIQITGREGKRYASAIELAVYADRAGSTALDQLLYAEQEFVETQSFSIMNDTDAIKWYRTQRGQMFAGNEASSDELRQFGEVIEYLRKNELVAGQYHYSMTVFSDTPDKIRKDQSEILTLLGQAGFKGVVQTDVPESSWFFQLPGNWNHMTRRATLTSWNFACLSPFHNFMAGKKSGNPWGEAVCIFDSPSGQPFYFNFHCSPEDHDSTDAKLPGNTTIFGATGVGKTTLELFLVCMLNKYKTKIVFLDMDRGAEIALRAMGATYKSFERGVPTGINPFQWQNTQETRDFCRKLVTQILTQGKERLTAEEEVLVSTAIERVFGMSQPLRRLALVAQQLPPTELHGRSSLQAKIRRWVNDGDLAWVLDNPQDTLKLDSNTKFGFDYSTFIDDKEICPPFVMCLLHISETLIDGTPFALFMEEFWKPLQNPAFSEFVRDKLKTIRKQSGFVCLTTQQPDDVLDHELAKTAVQQSVTGIYLPNPNAIKKDYVEGFKVTPQEFEIIRSLPAASRAFLVKQDGKSAVVRFDLGGLDDVITILSGSQDNIELLDEIRKEVGDEPEIWAPRLIDQVNARREDRKTERAAA